MLVSAHCAEHLTTHTLEALWNGADRLGARSPRENVLRLCVKYFR